jgi:hypothetical protein
MTVWAAATSGARFEPAAERAILSGVTPDGADEDTVSVTLAATFACGNVAVADPALMKTAGIAVVPVVLAVAVCVAAPLVVCGRLAGEPPPHAASAPMSKKVLNRTNNDLTNRQLLGTKATTLTKTKSSDSPIRSAFRDRMLDYFDRPVYEELTFINVAQCRNRVHDDRRDDQFASRGTQSYTIKFS